MDRERDIDRLEHELGKAWRQSAPPAVPEDWQAKVMDTVRTAEPPKANHFLEKIVLRSALLAACAASAVLLLVPSSALQFTRELISMVMLDPAGFLRDLPIDF